MSELIRMYATGTCDGFGSLLETLAARDDVQIVGVTAVRYDVRALVVPDPSERCTTWMPVDGRPVFPSAAIILSFQFLTLPAKMAANVSGLSFRLLTAERLYSMAMPPPDQGMCRT